MDLAAQTDTSATLLGRLKQIPQDEEAWRQFVERYGRKIHAWCLKWRLQEDDAQDVTQTVLLKLAERMRTFAYDPARSFHGWLKTVTHHAWQDFLKSRRRLIVGDDRLMLELESVAAHDDLVSELEPEFQRDLLEAAMARVQLRVSKNTWRAFQLTAFEERSGESSAGELGMSVSAVFRAKNRVKTMIQEECARLNRPDA